MNSNKAPFLPVWALISICYLCLVTLSIVSFTGNKPGNNLQISERIHSKDIPILFFGDPLLTSKELIEDLRNTNPVFFFKERHNNKNSSYSIISEESYHIIDSLSIQKIHVIGTGIGGASAIHFAGTFPESTQSLSLIAANGIIEYELLGGYHFNTAIYRVKYSFLVFIKYAVPHFGSFKHIDSRIQRAKTQFQSDQRIIRSLLQRVSAPVSIWHTLDARVPVEASKEHERLLPQSNLEILEKSSGSISDNILNFLSKVEEQGVAKRQVATTERVMKSLLPFDQSKTIRAEGKALIILMLVIILSTLISEDLTCIGTGLMIARGLIGFTPGLFACLIGIFVGDILLYLAGRWLASSTLHKVPLRWFINEKDIQQSSRWFEAKGPAIIIASRFIPGTRFPTYFSAGAIGASFWMFIVYFGVASIIWTPVLVSLAVLIGQEMVGYFNLYQDYSFWVLSGVFAIAFIVFKILLPMLTFKGRRLLIGKSKRILKWEFWPPFVIYTFVLGYVLFLWIKYRSATVFALANPAIPEGGFIKESKKLILDSIKAKGSVANYDLIDASLKPEEKLGVVLDFMSTNQYSFPIVIKPNIGERGKGVHILKNKEELAQVLDGLSVDYLVQEFVDGEEYGVFYYREPNKAIGEIFSVTRKIYLSIKGDGKHTLEELILKDARAVCMAETHFEKHIDYLYTIPEAGVKIPLVELGTHSRGAIFKEGSHLITEPLTKGIDRISKSFEGFYYGRFDIKVPSTEHLKRGKNLTVIELNGVTSESTNIYDPNYSFFFGLKTLIKQWRLVYKIGAKVKQQNPSLKVPKFTYMLSMLR